MTQDELKRVLEYCPDTGLFKWLVSNNPRVRVGSVAGWVQHGYRNIKIGGSTHKAHRLACFYMTGSMPADTTDHINGDRDDNRFVNLRFVAQQVNNKNKKKYSNNSTGIPGVRWHSKDKAWSARIAQKHIGNFNTLFEAACARKSAELDDGYHLNHGRIS